MTEIPSGKKLAEFTGDKGTIVPIVFSQSGRKAATAHPAEGNIIRVRKMPEANAVTQSATTPVTT